MKRYHCELEQSDFFDDFPLGYHHVVRAHWDEIKKLTPPPGITRTEDYLFQINPEDHEFRSQYFSCLPDFLANYFAQRYANLFKNKGRRIANTWLRETMGEKVTPRYKLVKNRYKTSSDDFYADLENLTSYESEQICEFGWRVSLAAIASFNSYTERFKEPANSDEEIYSRTEETYLTLTLLIEHLGIKAPYKQQYEKGRSRLELNQLESGILRMLDSDWITRQLKRMRDIQREHFAIAVGQVQKKASIYVSKSTKYEWIAQKKKNKEFFNAHELENEDGERIPLADMVYASVANPAIRRCELMVRMRGFEDIAEETGCIGGFFTITAPSKYHSVHNEGGFVKNWNGSNPRDTQKYLCSVWAKIRSSLKRQKINIFGFRVVEPHHDGTPHWHLLLFYLPEHQDAIVKTMREYAMEEDIDELKGDKAKGARFDFKEIEKEKGSATGYIAKYISKNIDGYQLDDEKDHDTGEPLKELAKATTAWASRWRIRQFQQIGGAPVTVYRECRRLGEIKLSNEAMDKVVISADLGDWAAYTAAQGGPLVSRDDLVIRLSYECNEPLNQYGEPVRKIRGILSPPEGETSTIITRTTKWKIVKKLTEKEKANFEQQSVSDAVRGLVLDKDVADVPWSSVNNCTEGHVNELNPKQMIYEYQKNIDVKYHFNGEVLNEKQAISLFLSHRGEIVTDKIVDILQKGGLVPTRFNTALAWRNGYLCELPINNNS